MKGRRAIRAKCYACLNKKCSSNLHFTIMNYCYFDKGKLVLTKEGKYTFGDDCLEKLQAKYKKIDVKL